MKKLLLVAALAACGGSQQLRFTNAAPVLVVNDRHDVPKAPEERPFYASLYHFDGLITRRLVRSLEVERHHRALGVNALDEVPDSTWFTNRGTLTLDDLRRGPNRDDGPELHLPWTIENTKVGGTEIGFVIKDASGAKYLLKFDLAEFPEQETATHVIVGRILWALGYNVTEDYVVNFPRDQLLVTPKSVVKDDRGHKSALTKAILDEKLAKVARNPDGTLRGMASRWIDGKPIGGHPAEGVRDDDPNDRIPHELRRDLRGAYAIDAWLDHVDLQESNFLDAYVADPRDPKCHYVMHYWIDFGKALGVMDTTAWDLRHGYNYVVDFGEMGKSLVTLGAHRRAWEGRDAHHLRGIGIFSADKFDPGAWVPDYPSYRPMLTADRVDKFWGAKQIIKLSRPQLEAIVDAGRLTDPAARQYLVDTLEKRQRATATYWFQRVNPLDRFAMNDDALCFDDLLLAYGLHGTAADTAYAIDATTRAGEHLGSGVRGQPDARGHACVRVPLAAADDGYTVLRVHTKRADFSGSTLVHVARDAGGAPRVIGIWRE